MSRRLPLPLLTLLAISMMVLAACTGGGDGAPEEGGGDAAPAKEAAEEDPIVFGFAVHLTGWMNAYDGPPRQGALLAIDALNAEGGILGRPLEVIELDGQTDPAVLGNVALQLIEQGADIIIAPCDFDEGAAASQAAQDAGLVGISTCASSPLFGSEALGDKQFTYSMWNTTMSAAAAEFAVAEGWETAYVVTDTSIEYSQSLGDYFIDAFPEFGGEVVGEDTYLQGDQDFSTQLQRIQGLDEEPDVLFISSYMPDIGTIVREIRAAGIETPILGGDAYDTTDFFEVVGPDLGNNLYFSTHSWVGGGEADPRMVDFIAVYEAEHGSPPDTSFIPIGWDVIMMFAEAIEAAGTTEGAALAAAMENLTYSGLSGTISWSSADTGHYPNKEAFIIEVQGAAPNYVDTILPSYLPEP